MMFSWLEILRCALNYFGLLRLKIDVGRKRFAGFKVSTPASTVGGNAGVTQKVLRVFYLRDY